MSFKIGVHKLYATYSLCENLGRVSLNRGIGEILS